MVARPKIRQLTPDVYLLIYLFVSFSTPLPSQKKKQSVERETRDCIPPSSPETSLLPPSSHRLLIPIAPLLSSQKHGHSIQINLATYNVHDDSMPMLLHLSHPAYRSIQRVHWIKVSLRSATHVQSTNPPSHLFEL